MLRVPADGNEEEAVAEEEAEKEEVVEMEAFSQGFRAQQNSQRWAKSH